jgi:amino acid adenylation domain-containing protein/non-ribosomal peptide synthase protein (TIGR01720 family)
LTQAKFGAEDNNGRTKVVCLDSEWESIAVHRAENISLQVGSETDGEVDREIDGEIDGDNLAYVIYTSGSTGRPKGAMNTHRAVVNRLAWMQHQYLLSPSDRVLQKTSFSFDVSVWEFFWPLLTGAQLVVAQPGGHRDSAYLVELIRERGITTVHFVPSMLEVFLQQDGVERCDSLQRVICSGEALTVELQNRFFERMGGELHNLYGPTEAAIDVSYWACRRGEERRVVPIGRGIWNIKLYVLDRGMRMMPVGVGGELYIGGVGVGRGYLNRAEMTAERYVPDPYVGEAGARMYRTGDRVRMREDGNIEYMGRGDEQVKVRGMRVELGEIEGVLAEHERVREVVVMAREGVGGGTDKRLVAYVVGTGREGISTRELQEYVRERLPLYMMPSVFVEMESMPLTPNGKIDRRALPAPEVDRTAAEGKYVAPRTAVEEVLAGIWSEVLGIESVGVHDNFFELGGDSILSIRIIAKANQAHLRLMPRQLFEHQTIAELASVARPSGDVEIRQEIITGDVPLTPVQHWFFEQQLADPHHFNQAIMFEVEQRMDAALLEKAWRELIVHHDALRLRFTREGGVYRQVNAGIEEDASSFVRLDVSDLSETEQDDVLEAEASRIQASLNLSEGTLLQLAVFERGAEHATRLLFVIHHLMVDHVSWQILLDDLQTAYQQLSRNEAVKLPAKTTSFQQWARRLTAYAQTETLREELPYWLSASRRRVAPLPADNAVGENMEASVRTVTVQLESAETQALLQKVPEAYRTHVQEALLAALAQSYAAWTGKRSLLVDLEGHGREEIFEDVDLSRTVGWFTAIFPVLLEVGEASRAEAALKEVKEQLRRIPQRGIGYGLLRYLSEDDEVAEQLRSLPQSEVIFNYVGRRDANKPENLTLESARETRGARRSLRQRRRYLLEINASIAGGRLHLEWNYSENRHRRETIQKWADAFVETLRALIAHCTTSEAGGYTPSDFPLARLSQSELDKLIGNRRGIEDIYPLSPIQQGLLFHTLYAPEAGLYFLQVSCRLEGDLNAQAFKRAWQEVAARHPALRTEFVWEGLSEPLQLVRASAEIPVEEVDWRGLPETEQQARLQSFFEADRARGFNLTTPPLMRVTLLRTAEDVYQVVWSHHHLIVDGWSGPLLLRECIAFYEAFRKQETIQLPHSRPYRD